MLPELFPTRRALGRERARREATRERSPVEFLDAAELDELHGALEVIEAWATAGAAGLSPEDEAGIVARVGVDGGLPEGRWSVLLGPFLGDEGLAAAVEVDRRVWRRGVLRQALDVRPVTPPRLSVGLPPCEGCAGDRGNGWCLGKTRDDGELVFCYEPQWPACSNRFRLAGCSCGVDALDAEPAAASLGELEARAATLHAAALRERRRAEAPPVVDVMASEEEEDGEMFGKLRARLRREVPVSEPVEGPASVPVAEVVERRAVPSAPRVDGGLGREGVERLQNVTGMRVTVVDPRSPGARERARRRVW